jgi:hypothetical protein
LVALVEKLGVLKTRAHAFVSGHVREMLWHERGDGRGAVRLGKQWRRQCCLLDFLDCPIHATASIFTITSMAHQMDKVLVPGRWGRIYEALYLDQGGAGIDEPNTIRINLDKRAARLRKILMHDRVRQELTNGIAGDLIYSHPASMLQLLFARYARKDISK